MNLGNSLREMIRTLKYSKKSDWQQFGLYLKLVVLGVAVVGGIAFVIHLIASVLLAPLAALIMILSELV